MQTKIDPLINVDFDKPLVCEVRWLSEKENTITECTNLATWSALAHDEIQDHDYDRIVLCGECVIVVNYKNQCECGAPFLVKLRKL